MSQTNTKPRVLIAEDESLVRLMTVELHRPADQRHQDAGNGWLPTGGSGAFAAPRSQGSADDRYARDPIPKHLSSKGVAVIHKPFDLDWFVMAAMGMLPAR